MKRKKSALLFLSAMLILSFSCITDEDDDLVDPRDKFLGSWTVNESCSKRIYTVTITEDPSNSGNILISNFADPGFGDPAVGIVAGTHIELDPNEKIGDGWSVSGGGDLVKNNRMEWNYDLLIAGSEQNCSATYTN